MNLFSALFSRDKPKNKGGSILTGSPFFFGDTISGKVVNERTALQSTAVYACIRILAESLASLPLHVYERTGESGKAPAPAHPLYFLLHDAPNSEMTSMTFRETLMTHLLLYGNAYAQILRNGRGEIAALNPLLPNLTDVSREKNGALTYTYQSDDGEKKLRADQVLHIRALSLDGLTGISPVATARNAIGMSLAIEDYGAKFFSSGATPSGILSSEKEMAHKEALRESWNKRFAGGSGGVAVLDGGMAFQAVGIAPEQAQFLETRKFQNTEIARVFRIPPHMLADLEKASFSNIEHQSLEFVKYSLEPWVVRWEQAMNQALFTQGEKARYFCKFNLDGLLRGDYKARVDGYRTLGSIGVLSANEIRALEELNPLETARGGDFHMVNGNMVKLEDVGAAYEKKQGGASE
jgi:HK97 family phage portal protein